MLPANPTDLEAKQLLSYTLLDDATRHSKNGNWNVDRKVSPQRKTGISHETYHRFITQTLKIRKLKENSRERTLNQLKIRLLHCTCICETLIQRNTCLNRIDSPRRGTIQSLQLAIRYHGIVSKNKSSSAPVSNRFMREVMVALKLNIRDTCYICRRSSN